MMTTKLMSHAELQQIEHATKLMEEHLETVKLVVNESEALLNNYIPILREYIRAITSVRAEYESNVTHILKSTRELSIVTSNNQNLINFMQSVTKLNELLTPEFVGKIRKLTGTKDEE